MRQRRRLRTGLGAAALTAASLALLAPAAGAEKKHAPLEKFFGYYVGKGVTKSSRADYYGLRNRDLNVSISAHGEGGFRIVWQTIRPRRGRKPKVNRTEHVFVPTGRARLWRSTSNGDPLADANGTVTWARIDGRSLIVYVMGLLRETGRVQISVYRRRLAPKGLYLQFRRIVEGRSDRFVEALLNRAAPPAKKDGKK